MLPNLEEKRNIDVIILVGGYGKRLGSASKGKAKPLVKINNHIFLEILIKKLKKYKFKRIILTVFHKSFQFKEFVKNTKFKNLIIIEEKKKLGTMGAIINTVAKIKNVSKDIYVTNGDTYTNINISKMYHFFKLNSFTSCMSSIKVLDTSRYGKISTKNSVLIKMDEKRSSKKGFINAGSYFFNKNIFKKLKIKNCSLEKNFFSKEGIEKKKVGVYKSLGKIFYDIGTPKDLEKFKLFKNND